MAISFLATGNTVTPSSTDWQLLCIAADGANGGGPSGGNPWVDMALGGLEPPVDGSVTKYQVYDTDTGLRWYNNSGTIALPVWKQ